jgi:hypothetical protein
VEIEAERLERTESEQEESMGETEEHECEMKQVEYETKHLNLVAANP